MSSNNRKYINTVLLSHNHIRIILEIIVTTGEGRRYRHIT